MMFTDVWTVSIMFLFTTFNLKPQPTISTTTAIWRKKQFKSRWYALAMATAKLISEKCYALSFTATAPRQHLSVIHFLLETCRKKKIMSWSVKTLMAVCRRAKLFFVSFHVFYPPRRVSLRLQKHSKREEEEKKVQHRRKHRQAEKGSRKNEAKHGKNYLALYIT